jgi:hypothetical protein
MPATVVGVTTPIWSVVAPVSSSEMESASAPPVTDRLERTPASLPAVLGALVPMVSVSLFAPASTVVGPSIVWMAMTSLPPLV